MGKVTFEVVEKAVFGQTWVFLILSVTKFSTFSSKISNSKCRMSMWRAKRI